MVAMLFDHWVGAVQNRSSSESLRTGRSSSESLQFRIASVQNRSEQFQFRIAAVSGGSRYYGARGKYGSLLAIFFIPTSEGLRPPDLHCSVATIKSTWWPQIVQCSIVQNWNVFVVRLISNLCQPR